MVYSFDRILEEDMTEVSKKVECYNEAIDNSINMLISNIMAKKTMKNFSKLSFRLSFQKISIKGAKLQQTWGDYRDKLMHITRTFDQRQNEFGSSAKDR